MNKYDGGTAYPFATNCPGMSMLDWFAGQALSGLVVSEENINNWTDRDLAGVSYRMAVAMLEERKALMEMWKNQELKNE